ncbi:hypothetical protein CXB51_017050 [Gossypium anomalum]|uniref:Uncharacterized protein n=1 Tax=Gossypium anomalum TaxID=47600 RepID=A0A8J6CVK6_9ROSI|nr:hypothetical protein CXB51_017050 [Gossypium anomalum]
MLEGGASAKFDEIERGCNQLKQETQMLTKQSAMTQIRLALIFNISKAPQGGYLVEACKHFHFLSFSYIQLKKETGDPNLFLHFKFCWLAVKLLPKMKTQRRKTGGLQQPRKHAGRSHVCR